MIYSPNVKFQNTKILIVDDCNFNRELLCEILRVMNIDCECANDGIEGIEKITTEQYDLVFMDINMPNKDGITAVNELKKMPKLHLPPIVALTASPKDAQRASIEAGMIDCIEKPISLNSLEVLLIKYLKDKVISQVNNDK